MELQVQVVVWTGCVWAFRGLGWAWLRGCGAVAVAAAALGRRRCLWKDTEVQSGGDGARGAGGALPLISHQYGHRNIRLRLEEDDHEPREELHRTDDGAAVDPDILLGFSGDAPLRSCELRAVA